MVLQVLHLSQRELLEACQFVRALAENEHLDRAAAHLSIIPVSLQSAPRLRAEYMLSAGDLASRVGSASQLSGEQERAKDLLSESSQIFQSLGDVDGYVEAQICLARCYWRQGETAEAEVVLAGLVVSERLAPRYVLTLAVVQDGAGRPADSLNTLNAAESVFARVDDHNLLGKFHGQRAKQLKDLGETDRAIVEYEFASDHFEQAGNHRYEAAVENNLGGLYFDVGQDMKAVARLDRAIRLGRMQGHKIDVARPSETKARILLKQDHLKDAERTINESVMIFGQGDERALLSEALVTQARIQRRLGKDPKPTLDRAVDLAMTAGDNASLANACLAMVEEVDSPHSKVLEHYRLADDALKGSQREEHLRRLRICARKVADFTPKTCSELESLTHAMEGRMIATALREAGSSVTHAAETMGIPHSVLLYKLKRHPGLHISRDRRKPIIRKNLPPTA